MTPPEVACAITGEQLGRLHEGMSYRVDVAAAAMFRRRGPLPAGAPYSLLFAATSGLYVGAAKLGINLSVAHGIVTPVWAPAGIALAALVLFGPRLWPAVALGALIANATSGASLSVAAFIVVGNTLEAVVGALLLRRAGFKPTLERVRDVVALVVLATAASTAIAATNGVTTLWIADRLSGSYGSEWLLWWSGDAMGVLVVAPLLLVWLSAPFWKPRRPELVEGAALVALLGGVSWFVFLHGYWRYPHLLFPFLIWAALRFRQRGAVTSGFVVAAFAVAGAVHGTTPLGGGTQTEVVQIAEGLLAAVLISLLILGAVLCERSTAGAELQRERAALADAQELAHIGSWEWDVAENRITCSDEFFRIHGLEPVPQVDYASYLERIHPDDRLLVRKTINDVLADPAPFSFEHRVLRPDGAVRRVHGRGRVIAGPDGRAVRIVGTSQDVTETRQLEVLRENILATVSHELRTPLTSILGFAVTLREHGASLTQDARDELVEHLVEQAQRLDHLLSNMLDLDRLRHGLFVPEFRATDVGALVRRVAAERPIGRRRIIVTAESVVADVDATKVEQIVENLLANAVKHTPAGTEVSVRVGRRDDSVVVAVDDRGSGIPAHEREELFELFSRGASYDSVPGAGVGLSLVAQFAALHGGRAWVEDNPGGGASFRVSLPLRQVPATDAASRSGA